MRVLAIDPGYGRCGVAVVEKDGGKEVVLHSDCIETFNTMQFPERLKTIVDECSRLMSKHHVDCVALEKLYFQKNQRTAMQVAEVRGALIGAAQSNGLAIYEYTPSQVKSAAAGWGGADKASVARMLHALVRIEKEVRHDDEYDAIAIGVTHLAHQR